MPLLLFVIFGLVFAQNEENVGLGDQFRPSVKASCVRGTMTIRVDTDYPFEGVIHGPNRTETGCSVHGRGALKTYLKIDLTQDGACGVKYNKQTEERRLAIAVRAYQTIELHEDKLFVVSCGKAGFQNTRNEVSVVQLKVTPPGNKDTKVNTVIEGNQYNIRAEVLKHDSNFGILVRRCFAFDETDTSLQLVDDQGCIVAKLISKFKYDHNLGVADATIHSMFRLPHSNRTYFQCDIAICRGECPQPECSKGQGQINGAFKTINKDPFESPEDDAVTTSTSVYVVQPGSEQAASAVYCSVGGLSNEWLLWLCIAFGVLLLIMLLINIFLCSAMTCSCTRSEIIEKEPSIYDDYSVYDSHYGYTNEADLKEYSGSDYGSEFAKGELGQKYWD